MKRIRPDYYSAFRCIAGECRHSCCIGWEIDIDEESHARYRRESGAIGERLRRSMDVRDGIASFRLTEMERCPFLNRDGLCDIILTLGEDALCRICADHPRFRRDFPDRTEFGLGLCCEAAASLILGCRHPVRFLTETDDEEEEPLSFGEEELLRERDRLIAAAQDRTKSVRERMAEITSATGAALPAKSFAEWTEIFLSLERLDPAWEVLLRRAAVSVRNRECAEIPAEQLLVYFLYRHPSGAWDEADFAARVLFAVLSVTVITELYARLTLPLAEIARLYSSEVEYSEENTEALLDLLRPSEYA